MEAERFLRGLECLVCLDIFSEEHLFPAVTGLICRLCADRFGIPIE